MITSITSGQEKQYQRLVEDAASFGRDLALKKVPLDRDGLQRLFENGDEFKSAVAKVIVAKTRELSISNQFADEEVRSTYTYPPEYRLRQIGEQVERIAKVLSLSPDNAYAYIRDTLPKLSLPEGIEGIGWGAFPSVDAIARRHFPEVTDPAERLCRATDLVLALIGKSRKFTNYRVGEILPDRYRMHARTAHALGVIAEQQPGDIQIFPFQFGIRHRGRSMRHAREVFLGPEFGLSAFHGGAQTLIHPERFVRWEQLHVDCPGDEYAPDADGRWDGVPVFDFLGGKVRFDTHRFVHAHGLFGSASGFLPQ